VGENRKYKAKAYAICYKWIEADAESPEDFRERFNGGGLDYKSTTEFIFDEWCESWGGGVAMMDIEEAEGDG